MASASSDEGEIIEGVTEDLKATTLPKTERNGVDRQDRHRRRHSPSKSPEYDDRNHNHGFSSRRSRSPRGYKRGRDDRDRDYRGGRYGQDPRHFRVHYEDSRSDYRRNRVSYEDLDQPPRSSKNGYPDRTRERSRDRYQDRDRDGYPDKRARHRSRSPYRPNRGGGRYREDRYKKEDRHPDRPGDYPRAIKYDDHRDRGSGRGPAFKRASVEDAPRGPRADTKPDKGSSAEKPSPPETQPPTTRSEQPQVEEAYEEPSPPPPPLDEEAEIERRRKRREAILAKAAASSATPLLLHAVSSADRSSTSSPKHNGQGTSQREETGTPTLDAASPASNGEQDRSTPDGMDIINDTDLINLHANAGAADEDGPSAADYDPTVDMREDGLRDERRHGHVGLHGEVVDQPPEEKATGVQSSEEGKPSAGGDDDDDDFNMFADDFDVDKYAANKTSKAEIQVEATEVGAAANVGGILEGQDREGYYKMRIGEVLDGRYQVQTMLGKGMFSGVVRAVDITTKKLVAIKMMRNNDALRKGGFTEIAILQKLNEADPGDRKHIVKFHRHFDHKGHLCMAFENLSLNLREVLKKFGSDVGINLDATRVYAHQIFIALAHMRKCSIIHADLKPDNILVNERRNTLKICDLGTAIDKQDAMTAHSEITPYLVSRFYRAPEIILGMPYDYAIDMWSIGCTLYELYTGKILFTGDSNNQMLKAIMEIRGKLTPKLYKRGKLSASHFDEKGNFVSVERDKILNKTNLKTYAVIKPTRDLRTRLMAASTGMNDAETRDLNLFVDLLEHCLALNPDKRIKPTDALKHPFFTARVAAPKGSKR